MNGFCGVVLFVAFFGEEPESGRKGWRFGEVVGAVFDRSVFDLVGEPVGDGEGGYLSA